jgi:glycerophosphoryl diester phosphodiesterase
VKTRTCPAKSLTLRHDSEQIAYEMFRAIVCAAILFSGMHRVVSEESKSMSVAERLLNEKRPIVIAHRGFSMIAPENTRASFELAIAAGADLVELDYHHSKDEIPVVMHDYTLDRTTDATNRLGVTKIRVDSRAAAEIVKLDAGSWFNPQFGNETPPTLSEALDLIQAKGVTLIERKAGDAATCIALLREKNMINALVVQAFDWVYLADFNRQEPKQVLGALGPPSQKGGKKLTDEEKRLSPAWVDEVKATGSRAVVWNLQVTKESVDYAHRNGLKVWVYTINDPTLANSLLDMGVDGIITDNPSLMWRTLALRSKS